MHSTTPDLRAFLRALVLLVLPGCVLASACSGGANGADGGLNDGPPSSVAQAGACSDLFAQDTLRTYELEIAPDVWDALLVEFHNLDALQTGVPFAVYHPAVLRLDGEVVPDASIKLHGQSSWLQAVMFDGDRAKMQFTVSFEEHDPEAKFHGLGKLIFDMPRSDWTFLHDRLAQRWLRQVGIMAPCSASGRLVINGSYYGLYVIEENVGGRVLKQFFAGDGDGDLWKGGVEPDTNEASPRWDRQMAFWNAAGDLGAMGGLIDLDGSMQAWAAESVLNNSDGYYGGFHNFYIYDQGERGFVFVPQDTDATFDWLALFDQRPFDDHPIFFWDGRSAPTQPPGPHWVTVLSDAGWRKKYADATAKLLDRWNVEEIRGWIDAWSQQIAEAVSTDPHSWANAAGFEQAIDTARTVVGKRAEYLRGFVDCENGNGADADGDGARWCDDCRDDNPAIHLGAPELCNGVDDNCNGTVDEGC